MENGFEMFMKTLENNDGIKYGIYIQLETIFASTARGTTLADNIIFIYRHIHKTHDSLSIDASSQSRTHIHSLSTESY